MFYGVLWCFMVADNLAIMAAAYYGVVKVDSLAPLQLSSPFPNLKKKILFLSCVTNFLVHRPLSS